MYDHLSLGGEIDQQSETRPEWRDFDYHYDFRISVEAYELYVETVLYVEDPSDPDDPVISVVNVHYV